MILKRLQKQNRGQSIVEFTLVLPFLLMLALGLIEAGYTMYHYLLLSNANREGVRLAARGRFADEDISNRIVAAAGMREVDGAFQNIFVPGENYGVIITRIPLANVENLNNVSEIVCCDPNCPTPGEGVVQVSRCVMGSINEDGSDTPRDLVPADSRINDIADFQDDLEISSIIEQMRKDEGYIERGNVLVVVETYFAHPMVLHLPEFFPIPDPLSLYFKSTMRVTLNTRR